MILLNDLGVQTTTNNGKDVLMQEYPYIPDIATGDKNCIFAVISIYMTYNGNIAV
jgi:hypothetical protein